MPGGSGTHEHRQDPRNARVLVYVNGTLLPALFGLRSIGTVTGLLSVISVMSSALGPLAFSIGAHVFGTYRDALAVFATWPVALVVVAVIWRPGSS